jgi:hypothetical protein
MPGLVTIPPSPASKASGEQLVSVFVEKNNEKKPVYIGDIGLPDDWVQPCGK